MLLPERLDRHANQAPEQYQEPKLEICNNSNGAREGGQGLVIGAGMRMKGPIEGYSVTHLRIGRVSLCTVRKYFQQARIVCIMDVEGYQKT